MAGPFVLIVLGIVFLMGTMHVLSIERLAHLFANYWPVLLIFWGVIKLIEHQRAQREGVRASGIGAGGIFLVLMIVVCGLVATQLERVNWSGIRDQIDLNNPDFDNLDVLSTSNGGKTWQPEVIDGEQAGLILATRGFDYYDEAGQSNSTNGLLSNMSPNGHRNSKPTA